MLRFFVPFTRSYTITYMPINSPWDVTKQNKRSRLCCRCWGMEGGSWRDGDASVVHESGVTSILMPANGIFLLLLEFYTRQKALRH